MYMRRLLSLTIVLCSTAILFACSESTTEPSESVQSEPTLSETMGPATTAVPVPQIKQYYPLSCDRVNDLLASVQQLINQGVVPQSTYNQIVRNRNRLCNDDQYFYDFVTGVNFTFGRSENRGGGGTMDGVEWRLENIFGGKVGGGKLHVTHDGNGNIVGFTASGGVALGEAEAKEVGCWTESCPGGGSQDCCSYQIEWTQSYAWIIENIVKSEPEDFCAPCP